MPYFSSYVNNFDGKTTTNINGGMDVKYGINEAFTLDLTLIPDFGQANFDKSVLNLSPFEQQFTEQRPFLRKVQSSSIRENYSIPEELAENLYFLLTQMIMRRLWKVLLR